MTPGPAASCRWGSRHGWWAILLGAAVLAAWTPAASAGLDGVQQGEVPQVVYLSPSGNDASCLRGDPKHPCRTFARAYVVARPGDSVSIGGGTYSGDQEVLFDPAKVGPPAVVFFTAPRENAVIDGGLDFAGASFITVRGDRRLLVREMDAGPRDDHRPSYLTISGVHASILNNTDWPDPITGANYFNSVDHLTLRDIEIGPTCCHQDGLDIAIANDGDPVPSNVVLDHVYIHDIALACEDLPESSRGDCVGPATDEHVDCLQFFGGVNVIIENSRFFNCAESDIMTGSAHGGVFSNWTIQNNLFGPLAHPDNGVDISDGGPANTPWSGSINILHNTFADGPNGPNLIFAQGEGVFQPGTTANVAGNAGGLSPLCVPDAVNLTVTYAGNVWGEHRCGPQDLLGDVSYERSSLFDPDLRLRPGSAGVASVDESVGPPFDAVGAMRPLRWKADAGALQREPAQITLGVAVGPISLDMGRQAVEAVEGAPVSIRSRRGILTATYRRFKGTLWVQYAGGRVVAIGTTSPYYSTLSGLGVGESPATLPQAGAWRTCSSGLQRAVDGRMAVAVVRRDRIAALWNVRARYMGDICRSST
jgi:hypothetical protein